MVDGAASKTPVIDMSGGISSLALKKKTHGASAMLLIAGSVSMFCMVRLSIGRSAVARGEVQDV